MNSESCLVKLVVGGLLTWRLASLLTSEEGPFGIFDWLRGVVSDYDPDDEEMRPRSELGRLLECLWCLSLWIALPVSVLLFYPSIIKIVVMVFAISALAILVDSEVKRI